MDYRERWELKDYLVGRTLSRRILLFHIGLTLLLLGFLLDFWYLQGVRSEEYTILAENNLRRKIPLQPTRGEILDRRQVVVASTRPSLDLLFRREGATDVEGQLARLVPIVDLPVEVLLEKLDDAKGRPTFEDLVLKEDVSLEILAQVEARRERFPAVSFRETARRHYPEGPAVPHSVGYVGQVSEERIHADTTGNLGRGDIVGQSGVERVYDEVLRGQRGWQLVTVNNLGRQMDSEVGQEPDHGRQLALNLDFRMQRVLLESLGDEAGAGVFMDPRSGEVLAIASTPALDPNLFADGFTRDAWKVITDDPRRPLHDRAIASFYAPGSTFKVVLAVAGLDTGTVTPEDRVFCNGSKSFYGRRRLCWKRGGHGWVDVEKALAQSCNVYFYSLGQEIGIDVIHDYGKRFGFGEMSGIDATGEETGILPSREWKQRVQREIWYPGDTISVAIGQGLLAVTPVQMARMISGVASGGSLPTPRLHADAPVKRRPIGIRDETLRIVSSALARAVDNGTGREATLGAFSVAGKTGTAQVYKHSAGVDSNDLPKPERDHAWFIGYAPQDDPTIAFAVVVEHGGHGGSAAAPIARKVLEVYFGGDDEPAPANPADRAAHVAQAAQAALTRSLESALVRPTAAR